MSKHFTRRQCLQVAAIGAASALTVARSPVAHSASYQANKINLAGYAYDRVRAIQDGRAELDGFNVQFHTENIYSLNRHVFGPTQKYDVSETGLIPFLMKFANEDFRSYTLLPVFILRTFRHRNIYVRTDRGIEKPEDLRGKRVATPGYAMSSHTWIRGMLQDRHGVRPEDMQWVETSQSSDGGNISSGYEAFYLPEDFPIERGPDGIDESDMILAGDVDALVTAIEPRAYTEGHPKIRRLFSDVKAAERQYFKDTGVFPIMHAVALRRDFAETHPGLPKALFDLYSQAKQAAYDNLTMKITLPWSAEELKATRSLMGENFWRYGVDANRTELELVMRYTFEQGLMKRKLEVEEVFHPETLNLSEPS